LKQEHHEKPSVAATDARAHNWTVMIMHLDAHIALAAMICSRRPNYLASVAKR